MRLLRPALLSAIGILSATVAFCWGSDSVDAAAICGPAREGHSAVAITIDRSSGTPTTRCAIVPIGATGFEVLRAAGFSIRVDEGFLCAIDGEPATGCGRDPSATHFWSYWRAEPGGPWTFSRVGAGGARASQRCGVQGWRWSARSDSAQAPRSAVPAVSCAAPPAPPTAPPTAAPTLAPTTTAKPAEPGPGGVAPSPGAGAGTPASPAPNGGAEPGSAATPVAPEVGAAEGSVPETTVVDPDGAGDDSPADVADSESTDADSTDADNVGGDGTGSDTERASAAGEGGASTGSMSGVFVTVLLVGALATAAAVLNRRRLRAESDPNA